MPSETLDEKAIFNVARQIGSPDARADYLRQACGTDSGLRERVQVLLRAYEEQASFLESPPPAGAAPTIDQPASESPGTAIGPYKLVEPIGEGGMGTVWMARQTEPVKRLVAVKLIKAGMDSKQVIARFEAERQALALMDHPNIARVLDAGTTDAGRPYFVMDLVKGVPITRYCDDHYLPPRQRLELFLPVCQAVQHAHQKGIIHRDLKPSNVLVAQYDGKPVPKVIDFGVAKAAGQPLTEKTLVTGFGAIVGTLEYMSPEQAEVNQLDVDTRSDIYSLGVLLYELLAGSPPFTRKELGKAGLLEILRVIREQEPSTPSTKLNTADGLPTLAANRGTEPAKLTRLVRGELDWIVMKALEKDRNRRYETAKDLAADLELYLADEPVLAGPPSVRYRLRKFMRRNKKAMAAVTAFLLLLLAATGTSIGLAAWALRERNHAEGQQQIAEAKEKEEAERAEEMRTVLEFVEDQVFATARPLGQDGGLGRDVTMRQAMESALAYVGESFRDRPLIEARLRLAIGTSFLHLGDGKTAETQFERARAIWEAQLGTDHANTLAANSRLASAYYAQGRYREALDLVQKTLKLRKAKLGPDHRDTLLSMNNLAASLITLGHRDEAIQLYEEALARQKNALGVDHPDTIKSLSNLARAYCTAGRNADALGFGEEALRRRKAKYGPDHPDTLSTRMTLGTIYAALGRHADALEFREETLRLCKVKLSLEHPRTVLCMADIGSSYYALGRFEDAVKLREEVLPLMKAKFGARGYETLFLMNDLAAAYEGVGRHEAAEKMREEMRQGMKTKHRSGAPRPQSKPSDGK